MARGRACGQKAARSFGQVTQWHPNAQKIVVISNTNDNNGINNNHAVIVVAITTKLVIVVSVAGWLKAASPI